jgi:hypothetical protein
VQLTPHFFMCRLVDDVRQRLEEDMEARAKQDVDSGAVAQSIVDSRGLSTNNRCVREHC